MMVHLQVLRQEGVARVLVHALLKRDGGLAPLDRVGVVYNGVLSLSDVHSARGVGGHIDLDHAVAIVQDIKVDVREEVVAQVVLLPGLAARLRHDLLHLANEAPDWQVVIEHLRACAHPIHIMRFGSSRKAGGPMWVMHIS